MVKNKIRNPNIEARNPKQARMFKIGMTETKEEIVIGTLRVRHSKKGMFLRMKHQNFRKISDGLRSKENIHCLSKASLEFSI